MNNNNSFYSNRGTWAGALVVLVGAMLYFWWPQPTQEPAEISILDESAPELNAVVPRDGKNTNNVSDVLPGIPNLVLLGVTVSDKKERSRASIEDESTRQHYVLTEGEAFPFNEDLIVDSIGVDTVDIEYGDIMLTLQIDPESVQRPRATDKERMALVKEMMAANRNYDQDLFAAGVIHLAQLNIGDRDKESLTQHVVFAPYYENNDRSVMRGFLVAEVIEESFYDLLGLKVGDLVLEVNGMLMDDPTDASAVLEPFSREEDIELLIGSMDDPGTFSLTSKTIPPFGSANYVLPD